MVDILPRGACRPAVLAGAVLAAACAGGPGPQAVTPADIPALKAQAQQNPQNADVRYRLAAAYLATGQCDSAGVSVRVAQLIRPDNVLGPLVTGACQEKGAQYDLAIATYNDFARRYPNARGIAAVRAKAQLALRARSEQVARDALARESELTQQPPEPSTLAVLPVTIASTDTTLQPLSRGLAELITTDLALIRTVRLLERLRIASLLDELRLGQSQRTDPTTAARVGRLLRVERMVQGLAVLDRRGGGPVQLSASVVGPQGAVVPGRPVNGQFKRLLDLEKELVFNLAGQLGIQLTEAERQMILRQGPRNMAAFLAYSEGITALDRGDYSAAAAAFGRAVQADPGFTQAQQAQQAAAAAPAVQASPTDMVTAAATAEDVSPPPAPPPTTSAVQSGTQDVAGTGSDVLADATSGGTDTGNTTPTRQTAPESQGIPSITGASGRLKIKFGLPR